MIIAPTTPATTVAMIIRQQPTIKASFDAAAATKRCDDLATSTGQQTATASAAAVDASTVVAVAITGSAAAAERLIAAAGCSG